MGEPPGIVRVYLFGAEPRLALEGRPLQGQVPKRTLALLAYLGLHSDRAVPRDLIAAALWPDVPDSEARANLRRHLSLLNHFLPPDSEQPWIVGGRVLQWDLASPSWFDVSEFERLARTPATKAQAVEIYTGDLFEGLDDEWIVPIRERYRALVLSVLAELIDVHERASDVANTLRFGRMLVRFDPLREDVVRRLMLMRAATGDRAGALQEFKEFERRLSDEMAAEPMRETVECCERIRRGEIAVESTETSKPNNNIPHQTTSFVGRESEIAEIAALIEKNRLVTLVGSGGVGKTRMSLNVVANRLDEYPNGVWLIELAPLKNGEYIPSAVAQTLGIMLPPAGNPVDNLVRALKTDRALFVFDNCEHVIDSAALLIASILQGCPEVKVLASSRQGLGIAAEATFRVPSLNFPRDAGSSPMTAAAFSGFAAMALFVERARAVDNRFALTDENAPIIADICRRLDGIPLAIELAATRIKALSPRQLSDRLNDRFQVLTGGRRDALPRQQTLRAAIEWSLDLLGRREGVLFRRLGIFVNGFTLEGAIAAGRDEDTDELEVLDDLTSLVDKSLVLAEPAGELLRYRLLESTRMYALEKLLGAGERDFLADRHLHYLRDRFVELRVHTERTGRHTELDGAFGAELEDVRSALDWALGKADIATAGELAAALTGCAWEYLGLIAEGIARNELVLATLPDRERLLKGRLACTLSELLNHSGRKERAIEIATQAVAHARASGDAPTLADALDRYAWICLVLDRGDDAKKALDEVQAIPGGSKLLGVRLRSTHAFWATEIGEVDLAADLWQQVRAEHRSLGNTHDEALAVVNHAEAEHARGQTQRAISIVREIIPQSRRQADKRLFAGTLSNLAGYLVAAGALDEAVEAARESLAQLVKSELDYSSVGISIEHVALVWALRGNLARAATLEGYTGAAFLRIGFEREFTETVTYDRLVKLLREGLTVQELARLNAEGVALTREAAVTLAVGAA
jgi:predicted ATPase